MSLQAAGPAPYAPVSTLLAVVTRHREVRLASLSLDVLTRMGVTESLAPRTMQSLRLLNLVDADGNPTDDFESLRVAPTPELPERFAALLRDAYAPVFEVVDPRTATVEQLNDAFRSFTPPSQRGRMVTLFMGLMAYAGMIDETPKRRPGPKPTTVKKTGLRKLPSDGREGARAALIRDVKEQSERERNGTGDTYRVTLQSGGEVSVVVNVNLFNLTTEDRAFVIDLVDKLKGYPKAAALPPKAKEAASS